MDILQALLDQKASKLSGNLYEYTAVNFSYNTNKIEGSTLSEDDTRNIFHNNTLLASGQMNIDDIIEMKNQLSMFDYMLDIAKEPLTEKIIKEFHKILKINTSDEKRDWFNVGEYKKLANTVGGQDTTNPKDVADEMKKLLQKYNTKKDVKIEDIIQFHFEFERIHPFQDGNGRVGRMIMFKECLKHSITPFIIQNDIKQYYYRGLSEFEKEKGYLIDTCLSAQDRYREMVEKFLGN
ncbi:MAG: Fic family protein [Candidatus Dojkabacteria bacterium]|jgi:Fic family protein